MRYVKNWMLTHYSLVLLFYTPENNRKSEGFDCNCNELVLLVPKLSIFHI